MTKKKSRELAGLETSHGDAWKAPAEGTHRNCTAMIRWQSIHNEVPKMRNSKRRFPYMLHQRSQIIMWMNSIQSPSSHNPVSTPNYM